MKKAIILLSGGLDSTTTLYYAISKGYQCYALLFDYGQKHVKELCYAEATAKKLKIPYYIIKIKLPWQGSALLDKKIKIPRYKKTRKNIPSTYVPARNTVFLSFATSFAEAVGAQTIFYGANAVDFSGYPDCRPNFVKAFQKVIKAGTKNNQITVKAPLIKLTKAQIIKLAWRLKVPLEKTWSCYEGGKKPCGVCDSCQLRAKGFADII